MSGPALQTIPCKDAPELLARLNPEDAYWRGTGGQARWIFRGQDEDWPLQPSAMRAGAFSYYGIGGGGKLADPKTRDEQLQYEQEAVGEFVGRCIHLALPLPEDGQLVRSTYVDEIAPEHLKRLRQGIDYPHPLLRSMFALAQHHGVPTRLLDWSRSPWIAAYFACAKPARSRKAQELWDEQKEMHDVHHIGPSPEGSRPTHDASKPMVVWAFRLNIFEESASAASSLGFDILQVTAPYDANPRLRAQRGLFTLLRDLREVKDRYRQHHLEQAIEQVLLRNYGEDIHDENFDNGPYLVKFALPHSAASDLLRKLFDYGVSIGAVQPDYDGAVRSIEERKYWK